MRRNQVVPQMLKDDVLDKLEAGELADARSACGYKPCAFSEVAVAAIDGRGRFLSFDSRELSEGE